MGEMNMGYRLEVEQVGGKLYFYGTKLFGYEDEEKLKSYKFLIKNKYLDEYSTFFNYNHSNDFVMEIKDFREFVKLYNEDLNNFTFYSNEKDRFIKDKTIQKFLKLEDDDRVVISWG